MYLLLLFTEVVIVIGQCLLITMAVFLTSSLPSFISPASSSLQSSNLFRPAPVPYS